MDLALTEFVFLFKRAGHCFGGEYSVVKERVEESLCEFQPQTTDPNRSVSQLDCLLEAQITEPYLSKLSTTTQGTLLHIIAP